MDEKLTRHGSFSWFELMTNNPDAAGEFYGKLFGWETEGMEMGGGTVYNVINVDGEGVGGIMKMPPGTDGMPSMWSIYVSVDDIDAAAGKAVELGGQVLVPPRDIPEVGRFCVIQDPQGALISAISYKRG